MPNKKVMQRCTDKNIAIKKGNMVNEKQYVVNSSKKDEWGLGRNTGRASDKKKYDK